MTRAADTQIRVMIVDDSTVIRGLLARIVEAEQDMQIVASAPNGRSALDLLRHRPVDVVLLDIEMPEMDGLSALPLILAAHPELPVIMTSSLTQRGAEVTMRALALGAADYVPKPSALSAVSGMAAIAKELVSKIRALGRAGRAGASAPLGAESRSMPPRPSALLAHGADDGVRIVAIASSTGGPNALAEVLTGLPADFSLPIVIAQHMPPIFTAALAQRLQRESGRPCREAQNGEPILEGHVYVAPGDHHMTVMTAERQPQIRLDQSPPVNYCRPAADPLFRSIAATYGPCALAVVLTGMGEDGLRGSREIAERGGRIVVQDQATSVVWGMPGAVCNAGLATAVLPVGKIAAHVDHLCRALV